MLFVSEKHKFPVKYYRKNFILKIFFFQILPVITSSQFQFNLSASPYCHHPNNIEVLTRILQYFLLFSRGRLWCHKYSQVSQNRYKFNQGFVIIFFSNAGYYLIQLKAIHWVKDWRVPQYFHVALFL